MLTAQDIINIYISFFEKRGHKRISNASLIPENDPTTLFTSSGMQPLVPYLLGEPHPQGKRLVNVQNCFRAQDIDEIGDNRHTTFFRMLGNWSLGDYFKKEQLPWFFEFLTKELNISAKKLYITVFSGYKDIPKDEESISIWKKLFESIGINPEDRIFSYDVEKNWWSRSGIPDNMPEGEPGGPDSEVFYDFGPELEIHEKSKYKGQKCHVNCDCGRFLEIGNSVFMQYQKEKNEHFKLLPQKNVDFGGGLERLLAAVENKQDMFKTSLFVPIIKSIEKATDKTYEKYKKQMRIITDHLTAAVFIIINNITPSNKEQGYVLRRLIRRGLDNFYELEGENIAPVLEKIVEQYKDTDPYLVDNFEKIKNTILEEEQTYQKAISSAKTFIFKRYKKENGEIMGLTNISADDAFMFYATHGLSPTQIKSLGYEFNEQEFAKKMEEHQNISRSGSEQKFKGGLADQSENTIIGHTATHLLHKALRDTLDDSVHQTGSNITPERVRFDFSYDRKLTDEEIKKVEDMVNEKIKENLPVRFEIMDIEDARSTGAIGLFGEKYEDKVKIYFVGDYTAEFCGGPHVDFTGKLKRFKIIKQENIGQGKRRIYAKVG
ncbi:MAG: alanine--tRNA ligase [Candidatus Levybacteria bacterium]|nr:alanine--tRNA ligase [Candidatus Levybacteria bacterium]